MITSSINSYSDRGFAMPTLRSLKARSICYVSWRFLTLHLMLLVVLATAFTPEAQARVGGIFGGQKAQYGILPGDVEESIFQAMQHPDRVGDLSVIVAGHPRFASSIASLAATLQPQWVGSILKALIRGAPSQIESTVRALVDTVPHATRVIVQTAVETYPESAANITLGAIDIHPDRVIEIAYISMKTAATLKPEQSATIAGQLSTAMIERERGMGQAVAQVIVRAALTSLAEAIPDPKGYTDIAIDVCENVVTSVLRYRPDQAPLYLQLVLREAIFTANRADRRKRIRMENTAAAVVLYRIVAKLEEQDRKAATDQIVKFSIAAAQVSPHTMLHLASAATQGATERVMRNRQDADTTVLESSNDTEAILHQYVTMRPHLMSELLQVVLQTALVSTAREEIGTADLLSESLPARLAVVAVNAASRHGPDALAPLSADAARAALSITPGAVVDVATSLATETPVGNPYRKAQAGAIALSLVRAIVPAHPESADALVVALTSIAPEDGQDYSAVARRLGARQVRQIGHNQMISQNSLDPDFYAIEEDRSQLAVQGSAIPQGLAPGHHFGSPDAQNTGPRIFDPNVYDPSAFYPQGNPAFPQQAPNSAPTFDGTPETSQPLGRPDVLVPEFPNPNTSH